MQIEYIDYTFIIQYSFFMVLTKVRDIQRAATWSDLLKTVLCFQFNVSQTIFPADNDIFSL